MPYISQSKRRPLIARLFEVARFIALEQNVGELNFTITYLCRAFLGEKEVTYERLNAIIGVLESAKLEFNRRMVVPYEDEKMEENGDVY